MGSLIDTAMKEYGDQFESMAMGYLRDIEEIVEANVDEETRKDFSLAIQQLAFASGESMSARREYLVGIWNELEELITRDPKADWVPMVSEGREHLSDIPRLFCDEERKFRQDAVEFLRKGEADTLTKTQNLQYYTGERDKLKKEMADIDARIKSLKSGKMPSDNRDVSAAMRRERYESSRRDFEDERMRLVELCENLDERIEKKRFSSDDGSNAEESYEA